MSDPPALRVEHLVKRFGGLTATDDVSLDLVPGEIHALIGPNGAGKSTLVGQIAGELVPDSGRIWLGETEITRWPVHARSQLGLARSYQITQFCPEYTSVENVMLAALARAGSSYGAWTPLLDDAALDRRARDVVERIGLGPLADVRARDIGHGEHRQLELAMALALEPKVLLLDEPLAGMSSAESEQMVTMLGELRGRYPILLIEHDMHAVFALADRISVLVYGKVIATGTPAAIREDPQVRSAYLGEGDLVS
jgi:branched-chain amino acid transport system ATP-binding protein